MKARIRRKSPLSRGTLAQAENLLSTSVPPEMQEVLAQLQRSLSEVHTMIDQQLHQTRQLNARAYADLRGPGTAKTNASEIQNPSLENATSASALPSAQGTHEATPPLNILQGRLGEINQVLHQKMLTMTEQIAARTRQVSAQAEAMQTPMPSQAAPILNPHESEASVNKSAFES